MMPKNTIPTTALAMNSSPGSFSRNKTKNSITNNLFAYSIMQFSAYPALFNLSKFGLYRQQKSLKPLRLQVAVGVEAQTNEVKQVPQAVA